MRGDRSRESARETTDAAPSEPVAPIWSRIHGRLQHRPDSEHEQILIRIGIAVACLIYLYLAGLGDGPAARLAESVRPLGIAYLSGALVLLGHLLWRPGVRPARRYAGMVLDMSTLTMALALGEAATALFYPFYLWITFGMGFRYGRRYLFVSAALSLLGFALVIASTDYWRNQPALAAGLWMALLVLPAYAWTLLAKLTDAVSRAEAANQIKSRFLATMSHELRTPLHAIIGMTDLLRSTELGSEQRDMVRIVRSAGQTLLDMIGDVLDIARIEAGQVTVEAVDFDLHALLATVRSLVHHQAADKGLELRLAIDPAVPYQLHGPARSLQQILINLTANAVKFTDRGSVTIRLVGEAVTREHATLRIEVQDTGVGIPLEAQERIFERFTQADESSTRRHGGTGLGLAIARQLSHAMGATLTVESVPGGGSCFTFRGRLDRARETERRLSGRVRVIGDPEQSTATGQRLASWGADVTFASRAEAIRMLVGQTSPRPAVILCGPANRPDRLDIEWAGRLAAGTLNVVLVGAGAEAPVDRALAVLEPTAEDDRLFAAVHAALAGTEEPEAEPAEPEIRAPGWPSRNVLVAEDNRINQQVIKKMLHSAGHHVTVVGNGEEALDALTVERFDVVLMDLNMPVLGGLDALKLHRFATGGRDLPPFVALTADATDDTRRQCEQAGFDAHLTKPVEITSLLRLIDQLTRTRPAVVRDAGEAYRLAPSALAVGSRPLAALDPTLLDRLRQLDDGDDFLIQVVNDFIIDAEQLIAELESAASGGDALVFRDRAHALRSSAAHIGATAVFELCLGWRGIGPGELRTHGAGYIDRLRFEFERLRAALLAELAKPRVGERAAVSRPH